MPHRPPRPSWPDRLRGVRRPAPGTARATPDELAAALLATAGPEDRWRVRDARGEGVDLVVELRVDEPGWSDFFHERELGSEGFRLRLRLDPPRARVLAESRIHRLHAQGRVWSYGAPVTVGRASGTPSQVGSVRVRRDGRWVRGIGPDRAPARDRLVAATVAHGWTWRRRTDL